MARKTQSKATEVFKKAYKTFDFSPYPPMNNYWFEFCDKKSKNRKTKLPLSPRDYQIARYEKAFKPEIFIELTRSFFLRLRKDVAPASLATFIKHHVNNAPEHERPVFIAYIKHVYGRIPEQFMLRKDNAKAFDNWADTSTGYSEKKIVSGLAKETSPEYHRKGSGIEVTTKTYSLKKFIQKKEDYINLMRCLAEDELIKYDEKNDSAIWLNTSEKSGFQSIMAALYYYFFYIGNKSSNNKNTFLATHLAEAFNSTFNLRMDKKALDSFRKPFSLAKAEEAYNKYKTEFNSVRNFFPGQD